ncbi:hypothetical protein WDU94_005486 [Cyamophila willieti]
MCTSVSLLTEITSTTSFDERSNDVIKYLEENPHSIADKTDISMSTTLTQQIETNMTDNVSENNSTSSGPGIRQLIKRDMCTSVSLLAEITSTTSFDERYSDVIEYLEENPHSIADKTNISNVPTLTQQIETNMTDNMSDNNSTSSDPGIHQLIKRDDVIFALKDMIQGKYHTIKQAERIVGVGKIAHR